MSKYFRRNKKKRKKKKQVAQCSVPSFRIDLQCSPTQRWIHIATAYRKEIKSLINAILSLEQYQISSHGQQKNKNNDDANSDFFSNLTIGIFERLHTLGGKAYIDEMKGIAKLFKKDGITIEHILLTHLLYESFCGCTSIISKNTRNTNKNSLVLGRTLDWIDFDEQLLRNLTIDIQVYRGNEYLYRYTTFAGYIGTLTALKFNQFGFAINFREFSTNELSDDVHETDSWPIGLLGRYICEHCNDYKSAMKMWNESPLMAPAYIIITGQNESMLITRDERETIQPIMVALPCKYTEDEEKQNGNKIEYILQTNIDHWLYEQSVNNNKKKKTKRGKNKNGKRNIMSDNDTMDSIRRLNVGHKCLSECGGNLNEEEIWKVLYEYPIHDREWTIYSTVMNVQSGYYKTIRHIY